MNRRGGVDFKNIEKNYSIQLLINQGENQNMFDLFNEGHLRHPQQNHNPCYRKVISYTFYRFLQDNSHEDAERNFREMILNFKQQRIFEMQSYLEMYPTNMTNGIGYVIVDSTGDGCFPLITRPDSRTQFNGTQNRPRLNALFEVMRDLENHQTEILELVNSDDDWEQVETRLERIFNYSRAANDSIIVERRNTGESNN